jgi:hypothetical protein
MAVRRAINSPSNPSHDILTRYLISFTFYNTQFDELILVLFSYFKGGRTRVQRDELPHPREHFQI